jgi:photosystem II stability/assembly factor-like uncharacterized protein
MFKRSFHYTYLIALFSLLCAILACNAPSIISSGPPATSAPELVPPAIPAATNTPQVNLPAPTPASAPVASPVLQTFKMIDARNGWAFSETNILRSVDGGTTWFNVTPDGLSVVGYPATFFMDANHAWVIIPDQDYVTGNLYRTQDGGASWTPIKVPFNGGNLQFLDLQNGFALTALSAGAGSEAVALFQTNDVGSTWVRNFVNDPTVSGAASTLPLSGHKSGLTFRDLTHGWVPGETAVDNYVYFFATEDGGHTWSPQNVVLPPIENQHIGAFTPVFFDQNNGLLPVNIFEADSNSTMFFVTTDGGNTWMPTSSVPGLNKYSVISRQEAVVWDGGPLLHITHDGMLTWAEVHPNINIADKMSQFQFFDATTGWSLTIDENNHSILYQTVDGGATWTAISS